jgi:hypothetical protein
MKRRHSNRSRQRNLHQRGFQLGVIHWRDVLNHHGFLVLANLKMCRVALISDPDQPSRNGLFGGQCARVGLEVVLKLVVRKRSRSLQSRRFARVSKAHERAGGYCKQTQ